MSYLDWHVGMKVVCVNASADTGKCWDDDQPQEGATYTLSAVMIDDDNEIVVHMEELSRSPRAKAFWGPAIGYGAFRFRPIQKRTTSIEIFRALLNPSKEDREYIELEDLEHSEPFR